MTFRDGQFIYDDMTMALGARARACEGKPTLLHGGPPRQETVAVTLPRCCGAAGSLLRHGGGPGVDMVGLVGINGTYGSALPVLSPNATLISSP